eukprot:gene14424-17054_t
MAPFSMEPRYHVYATLEGDARWMMLNERDGVAEEFESVLRAFDAMELFTDFQCANTLYTQVTYMMLNGLNAFLLIVRILEVCDFQPRMGILTRTLAVAASDLYHFFVLLLLIFMGYSITGHIVFGATLESFSDIWKSAMTLFDIMVFGDNGISEDFLIIAESQGSTMRIVVIVYYVTYALLVVLILLNFLLAIIMDSFTVVKEGIKESVSLHEEICDYGKTIFRQKVSRRDEHDHKVLALLKNLQLAEHKHLQGLLGSASCGVKQRGTCTEATEEEAIEEWEKMVIYQQESDVGDGEIVTGTTVKEVLQSSSHLCNRNALEPESRHLSGGFAPGSELMSMNGTSRNIKNTTEADTTALPTEGNCNYIA